MVTVEQTDQRCSPSLTFRAASTTNQRLENPFRLALTKLLQELECKISGFITWRCVSAQSKLQVRSHRTRSEIFAADIRRNHSTELHGRSVAVPFHTIVTFNYWFHSNRMIAVKAS